MQIGVTITLWIGLLLLSSCAVNPPIINESASDYSTGDEMEKTNTKKNRSLYQSDQTDQSVLSMDNLFNLYDRISMRQTKNISAPSPVHKKAKALLNNPSVITKGQQNVRLPEKKVTNPQPEDPYQSIPDVNADHHKLVSLAINSLLDKAQQALSNQHFNQAIDILERALRIDRKNPLIWNKMAKVYYEQNDYQQARSMAKKSNLYTLLGSLLEKDNQAIINKTH